MYINYCFWSIALFSTETWKLQKVDEKYHEILKSGAEEG
jgi:hypothetical protein